MLRRMLVGVLFTLGLGVPILSQEPPKQPPAAQTRVQPQQKERERDAGGQPVNIRIHNNSQIRFCLFYFFNDLGKIFRQRFGVVREMPGRLAIQFNDIVNA